MPVGGEAREVNGSRAGPRDADAIWPAALATLVALAVCVMPDLASAEPAATVGAGSSEPGGGWHELLSARNVARIKIAVASAAGLLLLLGMVLRRAGLPHAGERLRNGLLIGLAALATLCWWELLQFHHVRARVLADVHYSEFFHYYMGSKYFPELGYTGLYHCTALAVARGGERLEPIQGSIRDLATNELETSRWILSEQSRCTGRLSPKRWQEFENDVGWFRRRMPTEEWTPLLLDWGYNATPVWGLFGYVLANTAPISDLQVRVLTLLDAGLLLVTWACVGWAFGWRVLCVALVFWGTNVASGYTWTGGSYLRQGWVSATLVGLALLRRDKGVAAGFLFGVATLLRAFPGMLFVAIGLKAALEMASRRSWRLAPTPRRVALGGLIALCTLGPLSALAGFGPRAWADFAENTRLDAQPALNKMGLRTVLAYDPDTRLDALRSDFMRAHEGGAFGARAADVPALWRKARQETFERRRVLFFGLALGFAALLVRAGRGRPDWVAAILGLGFVPIAVESACYYQVLLVVWALLSDDHPGIGVGLCALAALGGLLAVLPLEEFYAGLSLAGLVFLAWAAAALWLREPGDAAPAEVPRAGA